jgi:hypothetical protein
MHFPVGYGSLDAFSRYQAGKKVKTGGLAGRIAGDRADE